MPNYDYTCGQCHVTKSFTVAMEKRDQVRLCSCGGKMKREFPVQAARGIKTFKPIYCEAFDCDVNSQSEWDGILKDKGLIEAGDKVHGARNFDPKATNIMPQEPRGIPYVSESERQLGRQQESDQTVLMVEGSGGFELAQDRPFYDPNGPANNQ